MSPLPAPSRSLRVHMLSIFRNPGIQFTSPLSKSTQLVLNLLQTHAGDSDLLVQSLEKKVSNLMKNIKEIQEEKEIIAREQEDLLVLLSDQDAKCKKYKVCTAISNTATIVDY